MKLENLPSHCLSSVKDRIEANIKIMPNGCWEWQLGKAHAGHGKISVKGHTLHVHRVYYQLVKGFLPASLVLDHFVCDNPPCVNPDHLKPVTHWENTLRGNNLVALNARKTTCKNGHKFTPQNTIITTSRGGKVRACRICKNAYAHKRDIARTLEYHARGLNSKGKPLQRRLDKRFL